MIKYLGSKRRLVPVLTDLFERSGSRTALDLFTGTTRVAQAFKRAGGSVTAVDRARYSEVFANAWIATDAERVDHGEVRAALTHLNRLPGEPGYFTSTFCEHARFFQPKNGARVDAVRAEIDRRWGGSPIEPILLTSLILAADRVDSTAGVQMAYIKQWAKRSYNDLELRPIELLAGGGRAVRADAFDAARTLGSFDLAYLDPPYNQHRYDANYHIWETLVAADEPDHYGVANKRVDLRDADLKSVFNRKREMPDALAATIAAVDAEVVIVSYNNESWVELDDLLDMCAHHGDVIALAFESSRYVGARIGIHNPQGDRVGTISHTENLEYVLVAGPPSKVRAMTAGYPRSAL